MLVLMALLTTFMTGAAAGYYQFLVTAAGKQKALPCKPKSRSAPYVTFCHDEEPVARPVSIKKGR